MENLRAHAPRPPRTISTQLFFRGCAVAARTKFSAAVLQRLRCRSAHQFFRSCFPQAAQAQLSPIVRQLFSGDCPDAARTICRRRFFRGCAGAALTNFSAAVFQRLRRRSPHQFSGSCFPEAAQAQLAPLLGSCFSEAALVQRSPIFPQLFSTGCAVAALTNFLAAVFRRLPRRSSHHV